MRLLLVKKEEDMGELVGVKNSFDLYMAQEDVRDVFKREALLLDRIAIHDFDPQKDDESLSAEALGELRWLYEQGIVFNPEVPIRAKQRKLSEEYREYSEGANELFETLKELAKSKKKRTKEQTQFLYELAMIATQLETRATCLYLREIESIDACWSFSHYCNPPLLNSLLPTLQPQGVLDIVFTKLPLPDKSTSWEHILEFKSNPDSHSKFLALRNWMNEVSRNKLTPIEIEQKLEFLMDQYQRHMQLHKMKTNTGAMQTIIVSTAEFIEDLVKLKWGKMAKSLFSIRERKVALFEGELKSPGNEVAYVIKANETFS